MQKRIGVAKFKRLLVVAAISSLTSAPTYAQAQDLAPKQVTGTVTDGSGNPIAGASVVVKGTTTGVMTDVSGRYSISVPGGGNALTVSFVGMKASTVTVTGSGTVDVSLSEDSQSLDEVVVIGYGTVKKRDLTGAVSSVSAKEITAAPVSSAAEAIVGKMAGVQVVTTEGSPDAEVKIRVRGGGSVTQDNSPLYIVDGFPVGNLSAIAPSDIASIDVLKDASSTAIYGARGANGVIIVTTKQGVEGRTTVSFNAYYGVKRLTKQLDVLTPYEFVLSQAEIIGATNTDFTRYFGEFGDIDLYRYQAASDWQDELFGSAAATQSYNMSISGGASDAKYNLSLSRNDEEGIMRNSAYDRTNIGFRFSNKINKRMSVDFNVRFSYTNVDGAGLASSGSASSNRLKNAVQFRPTLGIASFSDNVDQTFLDDLESSSQLYDPLKTVGDDYQAQTRLSTAFNGAFSYSIIDNLTYRLEGGYTVGNNRSDRVYGPATSESRTNGRGKPIGQIGTTGAESYRVANLLTYDVAQLGEMHSLNIMLGQELNADWSKSTSMRAEDFAVTMGAKEVLAKMRLGTPTSISATETADRHMASFFGRVNYTLLDRYLLTATMRADGSSKFAPGNQWGYFPSVAVAWRISDEAFLEGAKGVLSNLKLRLSYGTAGNNRISDDLWKMTYGATTSGKDYYLSEVQQPRLVPGSSMSNPDLRWETTITRNAGLDFGFLNSRLSGAVDLYWNTTSDLLISARIPTSTGYSNQMQNIGQTSNKGVELTLNMALAQAQDYSLSASFNIGFNKNNVDKLGDEKQLFFNSGWYGNNNGPGNDFIVEEGKPLGQIYGYVYDGFYTFEDFTWNAASREWQLNPGVPDNSGVSGNGLLPGMIKYKKVADDGANVISLEGDKTIIGDANPLHTGGFNLSATYKGFDASVFFNWSYGNDVYNANRALFTTGNESAKKYLNVLDDMNSSKRFMYIDPTTGENLSLLPDRLMALNENASVHSVKNSRARLSSYGIEDGSFLRLNTATLGYTLPQALTKKFFVQSLRVYVTGYNLWLLTSYSGYDPEVDTRRSTPATPGVDFSAYPRARSVVAGVNIAF
jgi:TonB-linked SusC/RagA family outer membrane protein